MVSHPANYQWSSFRANTYGETDPLITNHPFFDSLGKGGAARKAYLELFRTDLDPRLLHEVRNSTAFSFPLGDNRFKKQIERVLGREVGHATRGRPPKRKPE